MPGGPSISSKKLPPLSAAEKMKLRDKLPGLNSEIRALQLTVESQEGKEREAWRAMEQAKGVHEEIQRDLKQNRGRLSRLSTEKQSIDAALGKK